MPFECFIDPNRQRGTTRLTGVVAADEFIRAIEALYTHPDWQPGFSALWDARPITQLLFQPNDLEAIFAMMQAMEPRMGTGRAAFVVPREIDYTIARLLIYRGANSQRERRAFTTMQDAENWLGAAPKPLSGSRRPDGTQQPSQSGG